MYSALAAFLNSAIINRDSQPTSPHMQLDRLELIEKAFNLSWCKQNFVLPGDNIIKNDGEDSITVFVSDLKHLSVLGEFITGRLKSKCGLDTKFEEADAEEIARILNHLERSKQLQEEKAAVAVEAKEEKPIAAAPLVEAKTTVSIEDLKSNTDAVLPEDVVFYMEGRKSNLTVYPDELKLTPSGVFGFMTQGLAGEKTIPFDSIQAIQHKEGGTFTVGFLQFTIMGGREASGGVFSTSNDENSFTWGDSHPLNNELALKIRDYIKSRIKEIKSGSAQVQADSVPEQLIKLKSLLDSGVLTEDEFNDQKKKLLG